MQYRGSKGRGYESGGTEAMRLEKYAVLFCALILAVAFFVQLDMMNSYLCEIAEALKKIAGMNF